MEVRIWFFPGESSETSHGRKHEVTGWHSILYAQHPEKQEELECVKAWQIIGVDCTKCCQGRADSVARTLSSYGMGRLNICKQVHLDVRNISVGRKKDA